MGEDLWKDLAYAARIMRKMPAFAITSILTIALGIGASSAIFSVANAVLWRPLPYRNAGRLVLADSLLSNAYYFDLRRGTDAALDDMAAVMVFRAILPREDGTAERISKGWITTNFFRMLGAHTVLGRDFTEADGQPRGQPPPIFPLAQGSVAILSYDYFVRRYGADAGVMGHYVRGPGGAAGPRIIGVLQPGFKLFLPERFGPQPSPDLWIPNDRGYDEAERSGLMLQAIGALKPGMALIRAQAAVDRVAAGWDSGHPPIRLEGWHKALVNEARPALLALLGAVGFLLLIACANVANLLLVRAGLREREIAVRAALGARAGRITRQMLAEAVLLCGFGTVAGVAFAWLAIRGILPLAPGNLPRLEYTSLDWRVLTFAALAGLAESFVLGALPGWRAARPDLIYVLRGGGRSAHAGMGRRWGAGVVITEVALCFVLLIGAGLMFRSFLELRRVDPGYNPHGLLTFLAIGEARGFEEPRRRVAFLSELEDRLRAIPGVQSVGGALGLPLHAIGPEQGIPWSTEGTKPDPAHTADLPTVLPGYFETLGSRLLEGRWFTAADNKAGRNLAIIDESLARKALPSQTATGKRICVHIPDATWLEVIGVVRHQRLHTLAERGLDQIFMLDGFWGMGISRHWALRTEGAAARYAAAVRAEIARFAPGRLAVTEMQTMDATMDQAQTTTRFHLLLIGAFAAMAAVLAGVGLYGVLSSAVGRRTAEIGVRMALGAAPRGIFRLVIGEGLALSACGIAIGLAAALGLTRGMTTMLVGVQPNDPATFAAMTGFFLAVAGVACWAPARRAARLDPMAALREE